MKPLNEFLYYRLEKFFGRVLIANQGERARETPGVRQLRDGRMGSSTDGGERYCIDCPFCGQRGSLRIDLRQRLYIHHLWGVPDPAGGSRWGLIHCFKNDCEHREDFDNIGTLRKLIYAEIDNPTRAKLPIGQGAPPPSEPLPPPPSYSLTQLLAGHPALQYLLGRGFDPGHLSHWYGVSFCVKAPPNIATAGGRIIIPVFQVGQLRGWQARLIGEHPSAPKYYTAPGMKKSQALYGYDYAVCSPVVTIVEGVTSVWRLGAGAVALFGHYASARQIELLLSLPARKFLIAFDGRTLHSDGSTKSDTLESAAKLYHAIRAAGREVAIIRLPDGTQPDGLGAVNQFWPLAEAQAAEQGVDG